MQLHHVVQVSFVATVAGERGGGVTCNHRAQPPAARSRLSLSRASPAPWFLLSSARVLIIASVQMVATRFDLLDQMAIVAAAPSAPLLLATLEIHHDHVGHGAIAPAAVNDALLRTSSLNKVMRNYIGQLLVSTTNARQIYNKVFHLRFTAARPVLFCLFFAIASDACYDGA